MRFSRWPGWLRLGSSSQFCTSYNHCSLPCLFSRISVALDMTPFSSHLSPQASLPQLHLSSFDSAVANAVLATGLALSEHVALHIGSWTHLLHHYLCHQQDRRAKFHCSCLRAPAILCDGSITEQSTDLIHAGVLVTSSPGSSLALIIASRARHVISVLG